jgi:tetratricopeptide (TPR) repeat protein
MTRLTHTLLTQASLASPFIGRCASQFSPAEIRQAIAELVAYEHMDMARALCEAGLALYPESEDIVSISALLAELQQDWSSAQQHLEKLLELQGHHSQAVAWRHLIRVVRCQLDPQQALQLAQKATQLHPADPDLKAELQDLVQATAEVMLPLAAEMAH